MDPLYLGCKYCALTDTVHSKEYNPQATHNLSGDDGSSLSKRFGVEQHGKLRWTANDKLAEPQRREDVSIRFHELREALDTVQGSQRETLEVRHRLEGRQIRVREDPSGSSSARHPEKHLARSLQGIAADNEAILNMLKQRHAAALMETIRRHRRDQEELLSTPAALDRLRKASTDPQATTIQSMPDGTSSGSSVGSSEVDRVRSSLLSSLLPAQDQERQTLKAQQAREYAKWQLRGEQALRSAEAEARAQISHHQHHDVARREETARQQETKIENDLRWWDIVFEDRKSKLDEEELRILTQRDDPELPSGKSFESNKSTGSPTTHQRPLGARHKAVTTSTVPHAQDSPHHSPTLNRDKSLPVLPTFSHVDRTPEEPHPGHRIHYGPTQSWIESEYARAKAVKCGNRG